jgi:hypothetical protein
LNTKSKLQTLELLGGIAGWIWLGTLPFSFWFFFSALFGSGSWTRFFGVLVISFVAKNLNRGFEANKNRVAFESNLVTRGVAPAEAREIGFAAMNGTSMPSLRDRTVVDLLSGTGAPAAVTATDEEQEKIRYWQQRTAAPISFIFADTCAGLGEEERRTVTNKAKLLMETQSRIVLHQGAEIAERERRRNAALLTTNYPTELQGDFSSSTQKTRETVLTLLASGLAYELLLRPTTGNADIREQRFAAALT